MINKVLLAIFTIICGATVEIIATAHGMPGNVGIYVLMDLPIVLCAQIAYQIGQEEN